MPVSLSIGLLLVSLLTVFVIATLKAYRIYVLLRDVEKELIQEVTLTKQTFRNLVGDLFPEEREDEQPARKTIEAEEIN